ncbi:MAG: purine/pyrimidine permease [Gammaproteobacteria bacterium]|nr:purine/pyrimidine permease [Gammaproteobacteria bacterium]
MDNAVHNSHEKKLLYQADDSPPLPLTIGLGAQLSILCIGGIVLTPAIVIRAANGSEAFLNWAVFTALIVSGISSAIQATRLGRIGAGYVLTMGTSGAFIAVSISALVAGGPALLATLIIISSIFQFFLAGRLHLFRRILTPTVSGTVIMLIAVTVMPIIFGMLEQVPEGSHSHAAPISALVTVLTILAFALKARGIMRLWAVIIGTIAGSIVSGMLGLYSMEKVVEVTWFGVPDWAWPGFDLHFSSEFWTLLPAFVFVTLVGAIETVGDSVAIQQVSWKKPRAIDYKAVQGAVAADGLGNMLSGLVGTVPNTTYSTAISVTELTGVAARKIGVCVGILFVLLAFFPKFLALILAIPNPVVAAYLTVLLAMLFVVGMKIIIQDGVDYRKGLIAGFSFWIGVGCQNNVIFPEFIGEFAGGMLQNGMTAGGLTAVLISLFVELTEPKRHRIELKLEASELPKINTFLVGFASKCGWSPEMLHRLQAASEETLLILVDSNPDFSDQRKVRLEARKKDGNAVLEFIACPVENNLQDRIVLIDGSIREVANEQELSMRLLRHLASSVFHQQYHDTDIITLRVDA